MAFVKQKKPEVDENGNPLQLIGGTLNSAAGGQSIGQNAAPNSSGSFVNLDKFINANKGKSEVMAKGVANEVGSEVSAAKDVVQNEADTFNNDVQSNTNDIAKVDTNDLNQANTGNWDTLNKYLKGTYTGPTDFISNEGFNKVSTAKDLVKNTDNQAGMGVVLDNHYAKANQQVSGGEKGFDNLLIGRDAAAQQQMQNIRDTTFNVDNGIDKQVEGIVGSTKAKVAAAVDSNKSTADVIRGQLVGQRDSTRNDIQSVIDARNASDNAVRAAANSDINRNLAFGNVTADKYLNSGSGANFQNSMTVEQQARNNALAALIGGDVYDAPQEYQAASFDNAGFLKDSYDANSKAQAAKDAEVAAYWASKNVAPAPAENKGFVSNYVDPLLNGVVGGVTTGVESGTEGAANFATDPNTALGSTVGGAANAGKTVLKKVTPKIKW